MINHDLRQKNVSVLGLKQQLDPGGGGGTGGLRAVCFIFTVRLRSLALSAVFDRKTT